MTKTLLCTGCSSGIGRATALLFAREGWNVVATLRRPEAAGELATLESVLVTRLDVQDAASIEAAIAAGVARFGRIDVLVNNAGYGQYGVFETIPPEKVRAQFDVNVFGVMDVTRAILPHFRQQGGGAIVNVSSGVGHFTQPMVSLYCASKFALEGFSESLSYELASQGIAVKIVVPHGGIAATTFLDNAARANADDRSIPDYDAFVARTREIFGQMADTRTTSADDVAQTIYLAATDGGDRLRYFVGSDPRGFLQAKQQLPDADYVAFMRSFFAPRP
jgi:NAD(P)-dependent dehydrogenase (short-subunit alcohol dehydrogenase family)